MKPVTDPNLISQLEGGQNLKPVSDPALLAQLEGGSSTSLLQKISDGIDPSLSAGWNKSFEKLPANIAQTLAKKGDDLFNYESLNFAPGRKNSTYLEDVVNNFYNQRAQGYQQRINQHPLEGGVGEVLGSIGKDVPAYVAAAEKIPANFAAGAYSGYTGSDSTDTLLEKGGNALMGGTTAAVLSAIPGAGDLFQSFQPEKHAKEIMQKLSGGKSLEDNAKSIAQSIQNAYKDKMAKGGELYDVVKNQVGDNKIYDVIPAENSSYKNLSDKITGHYDYDLKDLHDNYVTNPTFDNARELSSQLKSSIRQLSKNKVPDQATKNTIQAYRRSSDALDTDVHSFLSQKDPGLVSQYKAANNYWASNVAPYRENARLFKIASGKNQNPGNVATLFKNPGDTMNKIVGDLGGDINNQILYSELGKGNSRLTAKRLAVSIDDLDKKGLGAYVTPELNQQAKELGSRLENREVIPKWVQTASKNAQVNAIAKILSSAIKNPTTKAVIAAQPTNIADLIRGQRQNGN
jgi:hypothetical protein